jgi:hypothetical protein
MARMNIQPPNISRSGASPWRLIAASRPVPTPYQPGRIARVWVQANTQGMARRSRMPCMVRREAGRDPMFMRSITSIGVAWRK